MLLSGLAQLDKASMQRIARLTFIKLINQSQTVPGENHALFFYFILRIYLLIYLSSFIYLLLTIYLFYLFVGRLQACR